MMQRINLMITLIRKVIITLIVAALLSACGSSDDDDDRIENLEPSDPIDTQDPVDPLPGDPVPDEPLPGDGGGGNEGGGTTPGDTTPPFLPQPFDVNTEYTSELHVNGSAAANGNGEPGSPFDNIPDAIQSAAPGTRIIIAPGTYPATGSFGNLQGEQDAPIAIVADGDVIIDAGGNGVGMAFQDARFLVMDGITVQNTGVHGINMDDGGSYATPGEYIVLRNMHFRNIGSDGNHDCLKLSGIDHFYIESSEFQGCNHGEAIDMVGCHDGVITGNHFHDVSINGVQTKGGSANILIHGNRFEDIPQRAINAGGNTGEQFFRPDTAEYEAQNITIVANIFIRTGSAPVVYAGCLNCIVANNTIVEPSNYVFRVLQENTGKSPGANGYFVNNIVLFNDSDTNNFTFFNTNNLSEDDTFVIDNNLWFDMDNPSFSVIPNGSGFILGENNIIQQDPLLDSNYRLESNSPAANQGMQVPGGVPADYDGNDYADPPELGAFAAP